MSLPQQADCLIIGGGPAGSTAATLLAESGVNTLLLERDAFPRFHVGESLMPETYWIFERLGLLEPMLRSASPRKVGVQFVSASGKESAPFFFKTHDPRDSSNSWHVKRAEFDAMLLENAAAKGANCRTGVRVVDILTSGNTVNGVIALDASGDKYEIATKVVIDAAGLQSPVSHKLGLRVMNPDLKKTAIWTYYQGAKRETDGGGVRTIILHTQDKKAWFWFIPMADDCTSVGLVADKETLAEMPGSPEEIFEQMRQRCPGVITRTENATRDSKTHIAKEFSYSTKQAAGEGWVLAGDSWGFIDPVYSSGVFFAMKSAELAADCVTEAFAKGDFSGEQLGAWLPGFGEAIGHVRKLVTAFYTPNFRIGQFAKAYPQHIGNLTDLLIGRIFTPDAGNIFNDLDPWLADLPKENKE